MKILQKEELEALPTARLLSLFRRVRKSVKLMYADITDYGNAPEFLDDQDDPYIKHCVAMDRYQDRIKKILNTREHIERGDDENNTKRTKRHRR